MRFQVETLGWEEQRGIATVSASILITATHAGGPTNRAARIQNDQRDDQRDWPWHSETLGPGEFQIQSKQIYDMYLQSIPFTSIY